MQGHQLGLWSATLRGDLESAWPWWQLCHAEGHAGDLPALAQRWAEGRAHVGPYDLGDALFSDGRVHDGGLALVVALAPMLDARGPEGRFARRWSARLLALARRRAGGTRWSAELLVGLMGEPSELREQVADRVVPLLPLVRAHHRRDLAMPATAHDHDRWDQALDLLTLEGFGGAAVALDVGWPEDDLWEGLRCGGCGVELQARTEGGVDQLPCEVHLSSLDGATVTAPVEQVPPLQRVAHWSEAPGSWVRNRLRGCDVPMLLERLAVRCVRVPCPRCGHTAPLVHRVPGAHAPQDARRALEA
jgi:hypothetical protein